MHKILFHNKFISWLITKIKKRRQYLCNLDPKCKGHNKECASERFWRIKHFLEYKLCNRQKKKNMILQQVSDYSYRIYLEILQLTPAGHNIVSCSDCTES